MSYEFDGLDYVVFPMEHPGVLIRHSMIDGETAVERVERDFVELVLTLRRMNLL